VSQEVGGALYAQQAEAGTPGADGGPTGATGGSEPGAGSGEDDVGDAEIVDEDTDRR